MACRGRAATLLRTILLLCVCSSGFSRSTVANSMARHERKHDDHFQLESAKANRADKKRSFAKLLNEHKRASRQLDAEQHLHLRRVTEEAAAIVTSFWAPFNPDSGQESQVFTDRTFTVVLYQIPPFVVIRDWRSEGAFQSDPGNVLQTRTRMNEGLSGLTIDLLSQIQDLTGCIFRFLYPCQRKSYIENGGTCSLPTPDDAFLMLTQGEACDADACPPGFWRSGCGNGHEGSCLRCEMCGPGLARTGCGKQSAGSCRPCAKGTFASSWNYRSVCTKCRPACDPRSHVEFLGCNATQNTFCVLKDCTTCPPGHGTMLASCNQSQATLVLAERKAVDSALLLADQQKIPADNRTREQKGIYVNISESIFGTCARCLACPPGTHSQDCYQNSAATCKQCQRDTYTPVNITDGSALKPYATACASCWTPSLARGQDLFCPSNTYRRGCGGKSAGKCVSCYPDQLGNTDATMGPVVALEADMACARGWFRTGCGFLQEGHCMPGPEQSPFFGGPFWNNVTFLLDQETFCPDNQCFTAGAHKIDSKRMVTSIMTTPYMDRGFKLVVKEKVVEADLMAWAKPFSASLWAAVAAEVIICAILLMYVEGYGTNDGLPPPTNRLIQLIEALYWSLTMLLGGADKSATTIAGRILFMAQLFFTLILLSIYTGNIASFLINVPSASPIAQFSDITDLSSYLYNKETTICYTKEDPSIREWIDFESSLSPDASFKTIERERIGDCLMAVYLEEATCTFYDSPIIIDRLHNDFYSKGLCGNPGGFCSDSNFAEAATCLCPDKETNALGLEICPKTTNTWTEVFGNLITVGDSFKPFGYGLGFRREKGLDSLNASFPSWHVPMSQVMIQLRSQGFVKALEDQYIPEVESLTCAQPPVDPAAGDTVLQIVNVLGLFYITAAIATMGCLLGQIEAIIRFFITCCPASCGEAGQEYIDSQAEPEAEELEEGVTDSPRDYYYHETDCDDAAAGELQRMNLAHFQLEITTRRLRDVERVLLKLAVGKNLLLNADDFDENFEKIRPPPKEEEDDTVADTLLEVEAEGVEAEGARGDTASTQAP